MKVVLLLSLLYICTGLLHPALAQSKSQALRPAQRKISGQVDNHSITGKWQRNQSTVMSSQGLSITNTNSCETFEVEVNSKLFQYKLKCGSHFSSRLLPIEGDQNFRIEKSASSINIVKMGYYGLKLQTGKARREVVRIPYVQEIYKIKVVEGKTLAFYREEFKVDNYGRIVQSNYLQAYGLARKGIKLTRVDR